MDLRPQPGPQEAFLSSPADVVIFGGEAGGGKSFGLLLEAARNVKVPGYAGIIFRRKATEVSGAGGLWDEALGIYPGMGARARGDELTFTWNNGGARPSRVQFAHIQHEKNRLDYQGKAYAFIGFDELCHFTASQWWYLFGRNRSTCGVKPYIRATCNPDPDSFVKELIRWWLDDAGRYAREDRSGVIRWFVRNGDELSWFDTKARAQRLADRLSKSLPEGQRIEPVSFTFIHSRLSDNPALTQSDPGYMGRLMAQQMVDRERLARGDWRIRPAAGNFFRGSWIDTVEHMPNDLVAIARGWDLAATEPSSSNPDPDWSRGVLIGKRKSRELVMLDVASLRGTPNANKKLRARTLKHDLRLSERLRCRLIWGYYQDPGQAGKDQAASLRRECEGIECRVRPATKSKTTYAAPLSSLAEAGNLSMLRADWNDSARTELEAFPEGTHDDIPDAASLAEWMLNRSPIHADLDVSQMAVGGEAA